MKILIIGASGIIGSAIYESLRPDNEVFGAFRGSAKYPVDITNSGSIKALLEKLPKLDAIINAAGAAPFKQFNQMTREDYYKGINDKLMGQVDLTHIAASYLNPGGPITLTTGILADYAERGSTALALVNGALHSFVMAAAPYLKNGIRLNVVSPGAIEGTMDKDKLFAGHAAVSLETVINAYKESMFSLKNGHIFKIYQ